MEIQKLAGSVQSQSLEYGKYQAEIPFWQKPHVVNAFFPDWKPVWQSWHWEGTKSVLCQLSSGLELSWTHKLKNNLGLFQGWQEWRGDSTYFFPENWWHLEPVELSSGCFCLLPWPPSCVAFLAFSFRWPCFPGKWWGRVIHATNTFIFTLTAYKENSSSSSWKIMPCYFSWTPHLNFPLHKQQS